MVNNKRIINIRTDRWILFIAEYELSNIETDTSKLKIPLSKYECFSQRDVTLIRIGFQISTFFTKAYVQFMYEQSHNTIRICRLRRILLHSITVDIFNLIC